MSKIINFFDGYTTGSTPTQIGVSNLVTYADDAAFEADNTGTPVLGNIYYNTTTSSVRYYQGAWKDLSDEDDISSLQAQITATQAQANTNTTDITNNKAILDAFIVTKAQANGLAPLDSSSKVPAANLPSYVDDVEEYADLSSFPGTGESGKIYVALDTNKTYRWSGTVYTEISPSDVNSVNGQTGNVIIDASSSGLGNVTNDAQLKRESGDFNTFTEKSSPVNDDIVLIEDSEDSFSKKKVKLSNMLGGGGQGGINYAIDSSDAESDIGNWLAIDGTVSRSTSSPLRGEASLSFSDSAAGVSGVDRVFATLAIDIDPADVNRLLSISFDFSSSSDFTDQFIRVKAFTASTSAEIVVNNSDVRGDNGAYDMSFETNGSANYRIELHRIVENNTAQPLDFLLDNVIVGPVSINNKYAIGIGQSNAFDTVTVTGMDIGATVTAPSKGTTTIDQITYNRLGDRGFFRYEFKKTSGGTSGTGDYLYTLPNGLQFASTVTKFSGALADIDSEFIAVIATGVARVRDQGGASGVSGSIIPFNNTQFRVVFENFASSIQVHRFNFFGLGAAANMEFSLEFDCPIDGWTTEGQFLAAIPEQERVVLSRFTSSDVASVAGGVNIHPMTSISGVSTIASFSGNDITIEKGGNYSIDINCKAYRTSHTKVYLYDVTNAQYLNPETGFFYSNNGGGVGADTIAVLASLNVTLTAGTVLQVRQYTESAISTGLSGSTAARTGDPGTQGSVIAQITITKSR